MLQVLDRKAIAQSMVADTYGWDTVYAIKFGDVNKAIANAGVSQGVPQMNEASGNITATVNPTDFGDWALALGSDGKNVRMTVPISALRYVDTGASVDEIYDNLLMTIDVCLEFIPQRDTTLYGDQKDAEWMELRLARPATLGGAEDDVVTVVSVASTPQTTNVPSAGVLGVIELLFGDWFRRDEVLQSFNHVFAAVNLNDKAGDAEHRKEQDKDVEVNAFSWLKPKALGYAVADGMTVEDSVFGVLAMTRDDYDPTDLEDVFHRVSAQAIPAGQDSAFLISKRMYLEKMLLPGIGLFFSKPEGETDDWASRYFAVEDSGTTIRNTKEIFINELEVSPGNTHKATIGVANFAAHLRDEAIEFEFIDMHHTYSHFMFWADAYHTIRTQAVPQLWEVDATDDSGATFKKNIFDLVPRGGSEDYHVHDVVAVKKPATQWVQIGLLGATLAFTAVGICSAYSSFSQGARLMKVSGDVMTNGVKASAPAAWAAGIAGEAGAATAAEGASAMLNVVRAGVVPAGKIAPGLFQLGRATAWGSAAVVTGFTAGLISFIESLANIDPVKAALLPDFKDFAAGVMSPIRWPTQGSGFTPKAVCFNGSFQIAGHPDFAD